MKKYIIGGIIGFLALPLSGAVFLFISAGIQPFYTLYYLFATEPLPEELEKYHGNAYSNSTDYVLNGAFLDEDSFTTVSRGFLVYREEPVVNLHKTDFASVCMSSFDADSFDVAITLTPEARETLGASFSETGEAFKNTFAPGGFTKRYFIEAGGDPISWFWVSGGGARSYEAALKADPTHPDMILKVPMEQLYNFQFYLINEMTDTPPLGCTPDVDPRKMPAWMTVIIPFWAKSEMAHEEAKNQD